MRKFKIGDVVIGNFVDVEIKVLDVGDMIFKGEVLKVKFKEMSSYKEGEIIEGLLMEYFRIIKEDKMEEIRVVRKLEDLDGLQNGMGLKIELDRNLKTIDVNFGKIKMMYWSERDLKNFGLELVLEQVKSLGFKFDYKPLRTVEEVLNEARTKIVEFVHGKYNYLLVKTLEGYGVDRDVYLERVDSLYLCKEQAQKYADELNEVIGVGK